MNTDPDPRPGDFDDELAAVEPGDVQIIEASPERAVSIQVVVSGTEAVDLERIAKARGQEPGEVVAEVDPRGSTLSATEKPVDGTKAKGGTPEISAIVAAGNYW